MAIRILDERWSDISLSILIKERTFPARWNSFFSRPDVYKKLVEIANEIENESKGCIVYPSADKIFRAFYLPLEKIKVVIIGQDPYHDGNAVGICFSVPPGKKINPSLLNIYTELESEGYKPKRNGDLSHWLNQGCLMLNTALTVEKANPEAHLKFWYPFSELLLDYVAKSTHNVAWLLMGKPASEFKNFAEINGHKAFITSHPSPLSAYRPFRTYPAFIGSGVFKKINEFLHESAHDFREEIEW